MNDTIWAFLYNSCVHESGWVTISLHYTKEGAEKALSWHKEEAKGRWQSIVDSDDRKGIETGFDKLCPFGVHEDWCISAVSVLP